LNKVVIYLKTARQLGLFNIFSVLIYRLLIKSYLVEIIFPRKDFKLQKQVFSSSQKQKNTQNINTREMIQAANNILKGTVEYYSYHKVEVGKVPNWFLNPFNGVSFKNYNSHWSKIGDFNSDIGDIKNVWELSRFNWLGTLACAYKETHNDDYLNKMNVWIKDWTEKNPLNTGPNWKCGQESSIRAINILIANEIIDSGKKSLDLVEILITHLNRISPTTFYAKAQDNNHGISEGVALYLVGYYLWNETKKQKYLSLHRKGIKLIENRVHKLIMSDGTFAQYSIVYHRMVLDILSVTEYFKQRWGLVSFSDRFYIKSKLAIVWYSEMIDLVNGHAPNMGANDGTYLFNYDQKEYRDFRPSLTLASSIFNVPINISFQTNHCLLDIFSIEQNSVNTDQITSKNYSDGGYIKLGREEGTALLRVPKYNFRPSHSDALHLDVWQDGINWIRDAGSFSYALPINDLAYYSGIKGHSTTQFDGGDQMPKLSRFLYGNWLAPLNTSFNNKEKSMGSGYFDQECNSHYRTVREIVNGWQIIDEINSKHNSATLRWILKPGKWDIKNKSVSCEDTTLEFQSNQNFEIQLSERYESLYYMEKTIVPVITIELCDIGTFQTQILFS